MSVERINRYAAAFAAVIFGIIAAVAAVNHGWLQTIVGKVIDQESRVTCLEARQFSTDVKCPIKKSD